MVKYVSFIKSGLQTLLQRSVWSFLFFQNSIFNFSWVAVVENSEFKMHKNTRLYFLWHIKKNNKIKLLTSSSIMEFFSAEVFFSWQQSGADQAPGSEDRPDWTQGPGDNRRQGKLRVSIWRRVWLCNAVQFP